MPKNKRKIIGTIVAATVLIGLIYYVGYSAYHQQHLSQNAATSPLPQFDAIGAIYPLSA